MSHPKQPWKSRIVGYGVADPDQLLGHDRNWRIHPRAQQKAMSSLLRSVGVVQNVLVNVRTQKMLDGHMRCELALSEGQQEVPVTFVDLSEEEELTVLASFDPIGQMAIPDTNTLNELIGDVSKQPPEVQAFLDSLAAPAKPETGLLPKGKKVKSVECPHCHKRFDV